MSDTERGWCKSCGEAVQAEPNAGPPGVLICRDCRAEMKRLSKCTRDERELLNMQDWFSEVVRSGMNGPSPGGVATQLGCSRSMIDRLVEREILERSEHDFKGQKLVIISSRSIRQAQENRKKTGNWTGTPVNRGS